LLGTLIVIVKDIVINVDSVGLGGSVDRNCVCKSSVVFSIVFSKLIESDDLRIDWLIVIIDGVFDVVIMDGEINWLVEIRIANVLAIDLVESMLN